MMKSFLRWASFSAVVAAVVACSDADLTFGGPLDLVLTSNEPVSVNDSLVVNYDVTGRSLLGIAITWGDATVDTVFFAGAQTAAGRVAHLYSTEGDYTVTGTVSDGLEGTVSQELSVTITP
ncbi:MAG: hypothetical protein R3253_10640 [Longimicrobiales bacterium]|nr:hypothetical protein [Longimicrobiales bacterium]